MKIHRTYISLQNLALKQEGYFNFFSIMWDWKKISMLISQESDLASDLQIMEITPQ